MDKKNQMDEWIPEIPKKSLLKSQNKMDGWMDGWIDGWMDG